jgi:uncharacterized repeat protein (TIGR03806 family)
MKNKLNLTMVSRSVLLAGSVLLVVAAVGCESSSGTDGTGGSGGSGGSAGAGGEGGSAGTGGTAGMGGEGGTAGMGGSGGGFAPGPKDLLSEWGLFDNIRDQIPADGVIPYELTSQLFTDYAIKHRFVTLRAGGKIEYSQNERWQSPVGTIYVKTFAYPPKDLTDPDEDPREQLIETRLMVHEDSGWKVWVYVYNEDMTDGDLILGGYIVTPPVTWTDEDGNMFSVDNYGIPSNGACRKCHATTPDTRTLGPSTGSLNRDNDYGVGPVNQIDYLNSLGMLNNAPPPEDEDNPRITYVDPVPYNANCDPDDWDCLHEAARSYFDPNCSHCHAPDGEVADKLLFLDWGSMDPESGNTTNWGVCKIPTSAGNGVDCTQRYDIFPGDPDRSLLLCRIESVTAGEMMAPLGRSIVHVQGAKVIRDWIAKMDTTDPRFLPCEF